MLLSITFFIGTVQGANESAPVKAARWSPPVNWSVPVKVASVQVSNINTPAGTGVWITFASAPYVSHNCTIKDGNYKLGGSAANIKEMTLLATTALVNARNVKVYWGGCDGGGTNGYPVLVGLILLA